MKKEIEVKILNVDPMKLRKNIKRLGGKQILKPTLFREFYFTSISGEGDFSSLRLRVEGRRVLLTLKVKKESSLKFNIRGEYEVEVSNLNETKKILELLGFKIFRRREKIRESYHVGGARIEIDQYPGVLPYMELEASNKKDVKKLLQKLGFPFEHTSKKTATDIIRSVGLNPDNLAFKANSVGFNFDRDL